MDDSGSDYDDIEQQDDTLALFEGYKFRVSDFEQENLAKLHGVIQEITEDQAAMLASLDKREISYMNTDEVVAIVQESSDKRSFRAIYGSRINPCYEFCLICVDVYFHSYSGPTFFLRSGYPDANLSFSFKKSFVLRPGSVFFNEYDLKAEDYPLSIIYNTLISIFSEEQFHNHPKYKETEMPREEYKSNQLFLRYTAVKYGILDLLLSPIPEFESLIKAYFIVHRESIKLQLDINSINDSNPVTFFPNSLTYKRNPIIMTFDDGSFASALTALYSKVIQILSQLPTAQEAYGLKKTHSALVTLTEATQDDPQPPESLTQYFQVLKDLRFNQFDFWSSQDHLLKETAIENRMINTNRLTKEIKILSQHLPCEKTGSIFVVMDSERMDLLKAVISGTEDTPYAHGLFEFHIACPEEYPKKPPLVSIATTGQGTVRFNPNLYDDGYVCLSVINTWDGDPSERWNPAHSNILQVLLSIQVLVMDNMIIQKEPEFDHLEADSWENRLYSNIVKYNNVKYAMLGMLKKPPNEFKEVIQTHFALKRNEIMETVDKWLEEAKNFVIPNEGQIDYLVMDHNPHTCNLFKSASYYSMFLDVRNELLLKLDELPDFGVVKKPFSKIEISEEMSKLGGFYMRLNQFMYQKGSFKEAGGFRHSLACFIGPEPDSERLKEDHKSLSQFKCSPIGSVFVFTDSENLDLIKFVVAGPIDTDYANGLFLFELALPASYPKDPPIVQLLTTGRFTSAFHERLLHTGEVLGLTWDSSMTLYDFILQVRDIFTSPSWADPNSKYIIRLNTIKYALHDWLVYPCKEFSEMAKAYFGIKKSELFLAIETWMEDVQEPEESTKEIHKVTLASLEGSSLASAFDIAVCELAESLREAYPDDEENLKWKKGVDGSEDYSGEEEIVE